MNRRTCFMTFAVGTALLITVWFAGEVQGGPPENGGWRADFEAALEEAEQARKPLIVHFHAHWCMPCNRMEREVFGTLAVKNAISDQVIGVKVNADNRQDLIGRFQIQTLPSDLVIDPLTGRELARIERFQDQQSYLTMVSRVTESFTQAHPTPAAIAKGDIPIPKPLQTGTVGIDLGESAPLIGLAGFCPVTLSKERTWIRGSSRYSWDYRGVTYHFVSRELMLEFRNDPAGYAPKLLGCDPVILIKTDRAVSGNTQFGAYYDDDLYLFVSQDNRTEFKANPDRYIRIQQALKVSQIDRAAAQ